MKYLNAIAAIIIFILLLVFVFKANAQESSIELVVTPEVPTYTQVQATPTPSKVDEFMKRQAEINQKTVEWMKTQELINLAK